MENKYGVFINGKHTGRDYRLEWVSPFTITSPEAKRYSVEIPGSDGNIDLMEITPNGILWPAVS